MSPLRGELHAASRRLEPEPPRESEPPTHSPAAAAPASSVLRGLDVRIYRPLPEVVIVRVGGTVDRFTVLLLVERVAKQLARAPHVVVDLGEVTAVDPGGLAGLRTLYHQASANGTEIHLARADDDAVRHALRITGLDQLFALEPTAETMIADLRARPCSCAVLIGADPTMPDLDGVCQR